MSAQLVKNINEYVSLFLSQAKGDLIREECDVANVFDQWVLNNSFTGKKSNTGILSVIRTSVINFYTEYQCVLASECIWDTLNETSYTRMTDALWRAQHIQEELSNSLKQQPRKAKSANAVKRNKSAYLFCCNHFRDGVKAENPDIAPQQVTKILGEKWAQISKEKGELFETFTRLAAEDRERYEKENPSKAAKKQATPKKPRSPPKSPGKPRGKSAWVIFCEIKRPDVKEKLGEGATNKQIMYELGLMWASADYTKVKIHAEELSIASKEQAKKKAAEMEVVEGSTEEITKQGNTSVESKTSIETVIETPVKEAPIVVKTPTAPVKPNTATAKLNMLLSGEDSELEEEDEDLVIDDVVFQ